MSETTVQAPEEAAEARPRRRRARASQTGLAARLLLVVLPIAAFFPLLLSPVLWTQYDLVERTAYPRLEGWTDAWSPERILAEDPLSVSSYFWEDALPMPRPAAHRAVNLVLHLAAALLLLACLRKLRMRHAWLASLLFALHPAVVQALFWPGYRPVLLVTVLILAALFFALRDQGGRDYLLALAAAAAACLAHPAGYALPVILALAVTCQNEHRLPRLEDFNRVLPFAFVALVAGLLSAAADAGISGSRGIVETLNNAGLNLIFYLRQGALPFQPGLFHDYASVREGEYRGDSFLPFLLFIPFLILIGVNFRKQWARALLLGLGAFLLLALPGLVSLGASPGGEPALEEHGLYPALPALTALLVAGAAFLFRKLGPTGKPLWLVLSPLPVAAFLIVSSLFAADLRDTGSLWRHLSEVQPGEWPIEEALALHQMENLDEVGNLEDVVDRMNFVLDEKPDRVHLRIALTRLYRELEQTTNAVREYRRILRDSQPGADFIREAADFFESLDLRYDARTARERLRE